VERRVEGLAYVHIDGMGGNHQDLFEKSSSLRGGQSRGHHRFRNNGGVNISDTLINCLGTKPYGTYFHGRLPRPRNPYVAWKKPIVGVLMNDHSYSNAVMFPLWNACRRSGQWSEPPTPV